MHKEITEEDTNAYPESYVWTMCTCVLMVAISSATMATNPK